MKVGVLSNILPPSCVKIEKVEYNTTVNIDLSNAHLTEITVLSHFLKKN